MSKKDETIKHAVVLSPNEVNALKKLLLIRIEDIKEYQQRFPEIASAIEYDSSMLKHIYSKLEDMQNDNPRVFTLFEGIIITNLTLTYKYTHADNDNIGDRVEETGDALDTMFYEFGQLPGFYMYIEKRLSVQIETY